MTPNWKARYAVIWAGQAFSLVGSMLVRFSIIWWLTEQTGSATMLATQTIMTMLPGLLVGPLISPIIDRWNRGWIMAIADGGTAIATGVLALLFALGVVEPWHIYLIQLLRSLGDAVHNPTMSASTTLLVPRRHYSRVAGMNQTLQGVLSFLVPPLGALLIEIMPIERVLLIDVLSAIPAIVPLLVIRIPSPDHSGEATSGAKGTLGEAARFLLGWRGMAYLVASWSIFGLFRVPMFSLVPLYIQEIFRGSATEYGIFVSAAWVGTALGGVLMSTWGGFRRKGATLRAGLFVFCAGILAFVLAPANMMWVGVAATVIRSMSGAAMGTAFQAIMQTTVPPGLQGRVFSLVGALAMSLPPLGLAVAGPVADAIGLRPVFFAPAVVGLFTCVLWYAVPSIRNLEDHRFGAAVVSTGVGYLEQEF